MNRKQIEDRSNNRAETAYNLRNSGLKFKEVGERMGIGSHRARALHDKWVRIMSEGKDWISGELSRASRLVIRWSGAKNKEEVFQQVKSGRLHPDSKSCPYQYGHATHSEICCWLGIQTESSIAKIKKQFGKRLIEPFICLLVEAYELGRKDGGKI